MRNELVNATQAALTSTTLTSAAGSQEIGVYASLSTMGICVDLDTRRSRAEMIEWKRCRKKPIVVEFREVQGESEIIKTREGTLMAYRDKDFIIRGLRGEIYPIGKDIFHKSYDVLEAETDG